MSLKLENFYGREIYSGTLYPQHVACETPLSLRESDSLTARLLTTEKSQSENFANEPLVVIRHS